MSESRCPRCGLPHPAGQECPIVASLPMPVPVTALPAGTLLAGRFRVEGVVHASGMSTVYRAVDERQNGAPVALKEFVADALPPAERPEARAWLAREAGLLSSLNDARLPELLAAFSEGDRHYVAMPFLAGVTLEEVVAREGPQPELDVLDWAAQLADLLAFLHAQQPPVIHRDLKPANIFLCTDGSLMLLDLGSARPLARGLPGTAVGTPGYAPPEQYQGLADERSDIYALGATLHRLLTGYDPEHQPPFRYPPVRALRPGVSETTARLVSDLLRVEPQFRPANAGTLGMRIHYLENMAEAWQRWLARHPAHYDARAMRGPAVLIGGAGCAMVASVFMPWLSYPAYSYPTYLGTGVTESGFAAAGGGAATIGLLGLLLVAVAIVNVNASRQLALGRSKAVLAATGVAGFIGMSNLPQFPWVTLGAGWFLLLLSVPLAVAGALWQARTCNAW